MDNKTLNVLEYHKILERLSNFCDFSASKELSRALRPTVNFDEATRLLAETTEARFLLSTRDLSIGGRVGGARRRARSASNVGCQVHADRLS